ncbi:MAG: hypothetical protein R3284_09625, partial [Rubricoccaceae bacterium]|nr:hypothetical protein [Rubricoccaceae bacterium]
MDRLRIAAAIVLPLVIVAGALKLSDLPIIRYQEYRCQYEVIYGTQGPIDYAIFGNSRGMVAVHAPTLASVLEHEGRRPVVVDLAKSWRGPENLEAMSRDLLDHHDVGVILVEYNLAKSARVRYHEYTPYFLKVRDLARLARFENRDSQYRAVARFFNWLLVRLTSRMTLLLSGNLNLDPVERESKVETRDCPHSAQVVNVEANLARRESYPSDWRKRTLQWDITSTDEYLNTMYYRRMVERARANHTKIILFHVPEYLQSSLDRYFRQLVPGVFRTSWLVPPDCLLDEIQRPGSYHDPTHFVP